MKKIYLITLSLVFIACNTKTETKTSKNTERTVNSKPNIIILYVDDLGYSDVGVYGAIGVETPHIDSMANNGIKFIDAHSSAATCTPSRYSLLTGNYAFRNDAAILPGDAPLLIAPNKSTLPKMLKSVGYNTAVIGKWHLGLGSGHVNWNEPISPGANETGFDYSFLIPATGDRVPTVFVEDGSVVNLTDDDPLFVSYSEEIGKRPTGIENPELLKMKADKQHSETIVNGVSRIGYMFGGTSAEWIDEDFPYILTNKASEFINKNSSQPFFLYYSFHDIHVPRVPHDNFKGKSAMGPRGDAIVQVDFVVGEIIKELESLNLDKNTLIIFTSDNGPVLNDGYFDNAKELVGDHNPSGPFRGGKYSSYEAGTRVPTIVYWPETVKPKESSAMLNQLDLYASLAQLVGAEVPSDVIDSKNQIEAWLGNDDTGRLTMLEEGFTLSLREGNWKYIQPLPKDKQIPSWMQNKTDIESGLEKFPQLFNLDNDLGEKNNLSDDFPDKVKLFQQKIEDIKNQTTNPY